MKKFTILFALLFSLSVCSSLHAQKLKQFGNKGVWELGGIIGWSSITPVTNGGTSPATGIFQIQPLAGYFIAKSIELAIEPSIIVTSYNGSSSTSMTLYFAPGYNFIFRKSKVYPAIHALIGYSSLTGTGLTSRSGLSIGLAAGVKVNLLGNSLLDMGLQFQSVTLNPSGAPARNGQNIFTIGAGWSVFF